MTNSPCLHLGKGINNSMENMHTDVRVSKVRCGLTVFDGDGDDDDNKYDSRQLNEMSTTDDFASYKIPSPLHIN